MQLPFFINARGKIAESNSSIFKRLKASLGKIGSTSSFKSALAQAMIAPIRRNLDYQGIARKCLVVEPLPQGALPYYEKDLKVEEQIFGQRVTVPEFEIYQNPTIKISEVKKRRFNLIDRAPKKLHINRRGKLVDEPVY